MCQDLPLLHERQRHADRRPTFPARCGRISNFAQWCQKHRVPKGQSVPLRQVADLANDVKT